MKKLKLLNQTIKISFFLIILTFIFFNYKNLDFKNDPSKDIDLLYQKILDKNFEKIESSILNEKPELVFCPNESCLKIYQNEFLKSEKSINCAFFELTELNLIKTLENISKNKNKKIDINLLIDDRYLKKKNFLKLKKYKNIKIFSDKKRGTRYNNLMHNKFCIIDNLTTVLGSANPTHNGFFLNNNNILKFKDKKISKLFLSEFIQLKKGIFGDNKKQNNLKNKINVDFKNTSFNISIFFCPQDNCENNLLKILKKAKKEILFSSFVLTLNSVENLLLEKSKKGVKINGIVENRLKNSKGSIIKKLSKNFNLTIDKNKNTMHHKFFIVDRKYVITGSMNPSNNGVKYNDEFFIVFDYNKFVKMYVKEFIKMEKEFS